MVKPVFVIFHILVLSKSLFNYHLAWILMYLLSVSSFWNVHLIRAGISSVLFLAADLFPSTVPGMQEGLITVE